VETRDCCLGLRMQHHDLSSTQCVLRVAQAVISMATLDLGKTETQGTSKRP
jgi:hypothetical protein